MKPILFTVSYGGYWGQTRLSLEESIRKAKALGYAGVEVMGKRPHLSVVDCSLADAKELRRLADSLGIELSTLAAYTNFTGGLESREVPFVEMQLAYLKRMAELGEVLGAKVMRIFTGYFTDKLSYLAQWNLCADAVREAAGIAAQHGITLGVQNHHDIGVSAESYEDFLDQVDHPNCKAMFDAWSIALHDSDLYYWARKLAPRMVQTTVADYVKHPRWHLDPNVTNYQRVVPDELLMVPMGDGFIDYDAFFRGLKEGGFDGYVSYEMCWQIRGGGSLESLDACASKSLAEIKRLIG